MYQFAIVEFIDEAIFDLVSTAWLHKAGQCFFPRSNQERLLLEHISPDSERGKLAGKWDIVNIRLISVKGIFRKSHTSISIISGPSDILIKNFSFA